MVTKILSSSSKLEVESQESKYYNDEIQDMTYGRRLARYLSSRYNWYYSKKTGTEIKLDEAWEFFEHNALPRHFLNSIDASSSDEAAMSRRNWNDVLIKSEPGERRAKTVLYDVLRTPEVELGDLGLGVGIYFWTLRMLSIICFVAGILSLPIMLYFDSDEYDPTNNTNNTDYHILGLRNSAMCNDTEWVPCPTCTSSNFSFGERFASTEDDVRFALHNNCDVTFLQATYAFNTLVFVVAGIIVMNIRSVHRETYIDKCQQTTSDYSIEITNPPPDAFDPEEWKEFFSKFVTEDEVVAVTVTLNNEKLIRTLVQRRREICNLHRLLHKIGVPFDPNNLEETVLLLSSSRRAAASAWEKYLYSNPKKYLDRVRKLEEKARILVKRRDIHVTHIFVTFQTESSQRAVLHNLLSKQLSSGFQRIFNCISIPEHLRFRDNHILNAKQSKEPSSIHWHNLDSKTYIFLLQVILSSLLVFGVIVLGAVLIMITNQKYGITMASVMITAINQIIPCVCNYIVTNVESHKDDGSRQASLYFKMTKLSWINTAIVTKLITPFLATIDEGERGLTRNVCIIFFFELVVNPLLLVTDITGHIQRHILGPKVVHDCQETMNANFRGATFCLALRYTEISKILFLAFFYSAIFPAGFFVAAASLFINYCVDKFCLLRTYGQHPALGNTVAQISRSYVFPAAFAFYAVQLCNNFAEFPFDNLCETNEVLPKEYVGTHSAFVSSGKAIQMDVSEDDAAFHYCKQDLISLESWDFQFPVFLAENTEEQYPWMTTDQENAARLLGWTSVAILGIVCIEFLRKLYMETVHKFFCSTYKPMGEASDERFMDSMDHCVYIPLVRSTDFLYPLLACDISQLDDGFLDWSDPNDVYPYDKHNVVYDIPLVLEKQKIFSTIKVWRQNPGTSLGHSSSSSSSSSPSSKRPNQKLEDDEDDDWIVDDNDDNDSEPTNIVSPLIVVTSDTDTWYGTFHKI